MALRTLALTLCLACSATEPVEPASTQMGIVSLSPALTDTISALGAADELIGISQYCSSPKGSALPRLGGIQDFPLESLIRLKPTMIVTADSKHGPAEKLRKAGLRVETFSEGRLSQILTGFEQMGRLIGRPEGGQKLRQKIQSRLESLQPKTKGSNNKTLMIFSTQGEPVRQAWAVGPGGWLGDLMLQMGLENVLTSGPSYAQLSAESILTLKPDLIIELNPQTIDRSAPIINRWKTFESIPAVKNNRLHRLSGEALLRPGPRLIELAQALAKLN